MCNLVGELSDVEGVSSVGAFAGAEMGLDDEGTVSTMLRGSVYEGPFAGH